jgi:plasmid stabilization system protein ParE
VTLSLGLTPEARVDLLDARDWYEARRPGWGEVFLRSVEACFERIRRMPGGFQTVHGEVRRAQLRRFPHGIFYWIEGDQIVVFAIWHGRRDPEGWKARLAR